MVEIKVTIKNLDKIQTIFKNAPAKMTKELNTAIGRVVTKIESTAKKKAPVNKQAGGGNLRQSISSKMIGIAKGVVDVGASYGAAVHEGTQPHIIRPRIKKALANKRTGQFFGKIVRHPGTKAQPFLRKATEEEQGFIDKEMDKAVERALK